MKVYKGRDTKPKKKPVTSERDPRLNPKSSKYDPELSIRHWAHGDGDAGHGDDRR